MYVDDTDLLHWPPDSGVSPDELIQHVQVATTDYGLLAQASGGILKEPKCSVYFLDYKVVRGLFRLKSLGDLPAPPVSIEKEGRQYPAHICIP